VARCHESARRTSKLRGGTDRKIGTLFVRTRLRSFPLPSPHPLRDTGSWVEGLHPASERELSGAPDASRFERADHRETERAPALPRLRGSSSPARASKMASRGRRDTSGKLVSRWFQALLTLLPRRARAGGGEGGIVCPSGALACRPLGAGSATRRLLTTPDPTSPPSEYDFHPPPSAAGDLVAHPRALPRVPHAVSVRRGAAHTCGGSGSARADCMNEGSASRAGAGRF
jgi:hypothetical protein